MIIVYQIARPMTIFFDDNNNNNNNHNKWSVNSINITAIHWFIVRRIDDKSLLSAKGER